MNLRLALNRIAARKRRALVARRALVGVSALLVLWLAMAVVETVLEWPVWVRVLAGWVAPAMALAWTLAPLLRKANLAALARELDKSGVVVAGLELETTGRADLRSANRAQHEVGGEAQAAITRAARVLADQRSALPVFEHELAARAHDRALARLRMCEEQKKDKSRRKWQWSVIVFTLALAGAGAMAALAPRVVGTGCVRLADPLGDHPVWDAVVISASAMSTADGVRVEAQVVGAAPSELALVAAASGREVVLPLADHVYSRTFRPTSPTLACVRLGRARSHYFVIPAFTPPAPPAQLAPEDEPSSGHQAGALPAWLAQVANLADALEHLQNKADAARLLAEMAQVAKGAPPNVPATQSLRARLNTPALAGAQVDPDATPMSLAQAAKSDAKALRALAGTLGNGNGDGGTAQQGKGASERSAVAPGTGTGTEIVHESTTDEAQLKIKVEQAPAAYRDLVRAYFEALANKEKNK